MQDPKATPSNTVTSSTVPAGVPQSVVDSPGAGAGVGAASGAVAGAAIGAFAGPAGMIAGAVIGAAAGAATGAALADDHDAEEHDQALDEEIGITGGDLGAAKPGAKRAVRGTFSAGATGAGSSGDESTPADGPIPHGE